MEEIENLGEHNCLAIYSENLTSVCGMNDI